MTSTMIAISSSVWLPMQRLEQLDHLAGRSATVISQAETIAAATRNITTAVVLAAVRKTS